MMKLFIPIFLIFMSPTFAAWEQYSSSSDGGVIRYFDRSQVVRVDSKVKLPIKLEYIKTVSALEGDLAVTSGLMWFELDCK